jgi:hypothetical protein
MGRAVLSFLPVPSRTIERESDMATKKKEPEETPPVPAKEAEAERAVWTMPNGRKIRLKEADIVFLQMVYESVKIPKVPTYEVEIWGGGAQTHTMTAEYVKNGASPEEKAEWLNYLMKLGQALSDQTSRVLRATFLEGTHVEAEINDPAWERRMRIVGFDIPDDPVERWVFYLTTSLKKEDQRSLSDKIVTFVNGPDEEEIQAAVDSFRDSVRT